MIATFSVFPSPKVSDTVIEPYSEYCDLKAHNARGGPEIVGIMRQSRMTVTQDSSIFKGTTNV